MANPKETTNTSANNRLFDFGPFRLNASERLLLKDGEPLPLTGKALDLLLILVESASHLKSRTELIETLWPTTIVEENSLTWYVSAVRKALGDEGDVPQYIETVRGHGYRFIAPVKVKREAAADPKEDSEASPGPAPSEGAETSFVPSHPARRRTALLALAGGAIILIVAAVLVWRFALPGPAGKGSATPAIAVLPFENLSVDQTNAYFAAGIQDTILSKLAGIGELRVISRTSTERYPSHPLNLRQVAAQLGVGAVLEGSVQKSGNRVLINVQLIDAKSNDHIWAQTYTRSLADVFAVENDVATQVASALRAELLPAEAARLTLLSTEDTQAYLLFLKANYFASRVLNKKNAQNPAAAITQAIALYRQAIERDPHFALAWARLSYLYSYAYWYEFDTTQQRVKAAEHAAKRALALDPELPEAHLALGYVDYYGRRDYAAALVQFERARQSLPNDADMIGAIAYIHRRQGKWQEALSDLRQAALLDPRNPLWPNEAGITLVILRHYAPAQPEFDRASALEPFNYEVSIRKIWALLLAGDSTQARRALAETPHGADPQGLTATLRFQAAWLDREPDRALAALVNAPAWVQGSVAVGKLPKSLLQAEAWTMKGDIVQAHQAYLYAYTTLQNALHHGPQSPDLWSGLGLAAAGLGYKAEAIAAGRRATKLRPVTVDALDGPIYLAALAKIYARLGEPDPTVKLLGRLLAMPAGLVISAQTLKRDPVWDPIRQDPGFQALLKKYGNKTQSQQAWLPRSTHKAGVTIPAGINRRINSLVILRWRPSSTVD